ncbi:MAG TPA: 50S ribosomal protein L29 [Microscillaceae bacterium]|jgi:large subunit ribosomal protein L29|nr:50S ribosomal protein L29 [Microscillaceae bacterium]
MKNDEIRALSTEELAVKVAQEKELLQKLKFAHAVSAIENPMRLKYAKRHVARLLTELSKRNKQ